MVMVNVRPLLYSLAGLGASIGTFAQTWDGGAGTGSYGSSTNWNPNAIPGNVVVNFDGAHANNQRHIDLGTTRTVAGIVFFSAGGTNPFTFSNGTFNVGSSGIVNNDGATQVFDSSMTVALTASQTWNAASGNIRFDSDINIGGNTLTFTGAKDFTLTGSITGGGTVIKQGSGTIYVDEPGGRFSGPVQLQAGAIIASASGSWSVPLDFTITGGLFQLSPGTDFQGFDGAESISGGGILRLTPLHEISSIINNHASLTFGATGGTLDLGSPLSSGTTLGSTTVNASAATPGIIQYGTIANSTSPFGWDTSGHILTIANGDLSGSGALSLKLSNGALVSYEQSSFSGSLNFTGVSGGSASAGSSGATVGRLLLDSASTFTVANGVTFDNAMQVTVNGARTFDANLTINSGTTAFEGGSRSGTGNDILTIGASGTTKTLTVKTGATATFDQRFRTDSTLNNIGGITLNDNTILQAGARLNFTKSATVTGETVNTITVNGDITGQGTATSESLLTLNTSSVTFLAGAGAAGSDLIVNGTGLGGLRLEGTKARLDTLLTPQRFQDLTGSGGTLTIAYTDNGTTTFTSAPNVASMVRLGFDSVSGSTPTYQVGAAINDMLSWGGLVVKGGTVRVMFNESITGSTAITTMLDQTGGQLILHSGISAKTLTFEGDANLTGGTLDGGVAASAGTLAIGGNLTVGSVSLVNTPNITMTTTTGATISGSPLSGVGVLTKAGTGTVTVNSAVSATRIDINAGTLLLGGANLIGNSTAIKLNGGSLSTGGYSDTVGTLTLAANSTINMGSGASVLQFANSSSSAWTSGTTLSIAGWTGSSDHIYFGNAVNALNGSQVSQIYFVNPNGITGTFAAQILSTGEIVPIPEPATIGFGALLVGSVGLRERRRLSQFFSAIIGAWRKLVAA